jgi:hypothetical protein
MSTFFDPGYFWFWVALAIVIATFVIVFRVNKTGEYRDWSEYGKYKDYDKPFSERFGWAAMFAVFATVPAGFAVFAGDSVAMHYVEVDSSWSRPIENLGDAAGVKGRFYLGQGSVNTAPVYMYYREENDGFHLYSAPASQSRITYTDGTPQMVVHFTESGNTFWARNIGYADDEGFRRTYEFQVPAGSIQNSYNLDAQ